VASIDTFESAILMRWWAIQFIFTKLKNRARRERTSALPSGSTWPAFYSFSTLTFVASLTRS